MRLVRSAPGAAPPTPSSAAEELRTDAFVSYAHEDREIAERLVGALLAHDQRVWLDRHRDSPDAIVPTGDWWQAVLRAIESAKAFIFIISAASAASTVCRRELDHALAHAKRVVPIALGAVEADLLHPVLRQLDWIHLEASERFDSAVASVVAALKTDLAWRERHAEYTRSAVRWSARDRDRDDTLRGRELREARAWLEEADRHVEQPTDLQREFIQASVNESRRRRRRLYGALTVAVAAIAVLIAVATTQYSKAGSRGHAARSRELASAAIGALPTDPARSLRLAVAAVGAAPTIEAQSALRRALVSPVQAILRPQAGLVAGVELSPDGRLALTWGESGAQLWRTADGARSAKLIGSGGGDRTNDASFDPAGNYIATGARSGRVRLYDLEGRVRWTSADQGHVDDVVFSPSGRLVISNSEEGRVRVRRASDGKVVSALPTLAVAPTTASFSPDGRLVVTAGYDGVVRVWTVASGRRVHAFRPGGSTVVKSAFFADAGRRVVTVREDGAVAVWRLGISKPMVILGRDMTGAGISADGRLLVTTTKDGRAELWRPRDGKHLRVFAGHNTRVSTAPFAVNGRTVALGAGSAVHLFDVADGTMVDALHPAKGTPSVAATGNVIATAEQSGEVRLWRVPAKAKSVTLGHKNRRVEKALFSPNGKLVVTLANGAWAEVEDVGEAWLWDADGRPVRRLLGGRNGGLTDAAFDHAGTRLAIGDWSGRTLLVGLNGDHRVLPGNTEVVNAVRFSPNGRSVAAAGDDGSIRLWRLPAGTPMPVRTASRDGAPASVRAIAFSPDGRRLASGDDVGTIRLWSIPGGSSADAVRRRFGSVNSLSFDRDGKALVAGYERRGAVVWNVDRKAAVATLPVPGEADGVADARFSPDEAVVATASTGNEGVVRLWRTNNGRAIPPPLVGAKSWLSALAFSPNGQFLAAAGGDGAVRVWDLANHQLLMQERPDTDPMNGVAWSPDGQSVLTAGDDGTARLWRCEPCAPLPVLLGRAERRLRDRRNN